MKFLIHLFILVTIWSALGLIETKPPPRSIKTEPLPPYPRACSQPGNSCKDKDCCDGICLPKENRCVNEELKKAEKDERSKFNKNKN
jgi:hypothetical protein